MAISVPLHHLSHSLFSNSQWKYSVDHGWSARPPSSTFSGNNQNKIRPIKALVETPPFPLFQPPKVEESPADGLEPADPDFYKIGYVRSMRAYGVEFKEGPNGFGVYATKDVEPRRRARLIMEIPLELMLTIRHKLPWMFFPDIVPIGHPIFDIINSTNPETDWDLRLACLLLYAFDRGMDMAQLICGGCRTLLMYTRGATSVRCSCCHTVNLAPPASNQVAHINCGHCRTTLMYPYGAPSVKCAVCHYVTNVGMTNVRVPLPVNRPNETTTSGTLPSSSTIPHSQSQTVVVENPMSVDESGKLVSNVVVGVTTEKK